MILTLPLLAFALPNAAAFAQPGQTDGVSGYVTSNTYDASAGSGAAPADTGATVDPLEADCTYGGTACQNVGLTHGWYSPPGIGSGQLGDNLDFLYTARYYCDTAVSSGADSDCEAGATYTQLPPDAQSQDPLYIPVPLGDVKAPDLQCPKSGHCIDHPETVDLSRIADTLGVSDPSTLENAPLNPHDHIITDRNDNLPEWWNVVVIGVTKQSSWDAIVDSQGNMTVVKALQADSDSGVTGNVPTNAFLYFQTLGGTHPDGSFPAYDDPGGPAATPGTTINPLTDKCTKASTQGTSSDTCNQIGITPGYLGGSENNASGSGHTVDFLYSQNFFCDSAISAESTTGCEGGADYTNLPPGTTSDDQTDPLFIITPIGFHPKSLQCPTQGYCIDHPTSVDLSRLAGPLGADPSTLTDVPLSPHDHIVLDRNQNQPEWWPVKILGVTDPAVYNKINASTNRYQAYQDLVAANNPAVTGAVDTNIFLWFQTLPGVVPTRLAGSERFQTAVATSQDEFPSDGTASGVVLARSDMYPDALTGAPLAADANGPLLLTPGNNLQPGTKAEIDRVLAKKSDPIYLVGGTNALSPAVVGDLRAAGYSNVSRVAGANRYATAVQVADRLDDPGTVYLATGADFADALSAGPAAIKDDGAILLTRDGSLPAATSGYLDSQEPGTVYAVGGPSCRADVGADCVMGQDRYTTSSNVADRFFPNAEAAGAATGEKFPDALAAGPDMAMHDGPVMLVRSDGGLPPATSNQLAKYRSDEPTVYLYGGPAALSAQVAQEVVLQANGVNGSPGQ